MKKCDATVTITLNVAISCRKTFYLYQIIFGHFAGFALFLEACVVRSGPSTGISLSAIDNSKR